MRAYGLEDDKDERDWQADRVRPVSLPSGRLLLPSPVMEEWPVIRPRLLSMAVISTGCRYTAM
jgi:hypothetical protein